MEKKRLVVGTYNIQHCLDNTVPIDGPNAVRVDKVAALLIEIGYEIVGLNEVYEKGPDDRYCDQAPKLAKLCGAKDYVFGLGKEFEWKDIIGNAVLSKYPIVGQEIIPVPAPTEEERNPEEKSWYEDRVIVKTTIDVGQKIDFISTHFGLNRLEQQRMIAALLKIIDNEDKPFVLCGDFNALPESDILSPLFERLQSAAKETGKQQDFTWASYDPQRTLDYIFLSKEFKVLEFEVVKTVLSDHLPLRAVVEL
jgi:endonuclease/exonuclease/phosphatase family metal-dependent hydrolase